MGYGMDQLTAKTFFCAIRRWNVIFGDAFVIS